MSTQEQIDALIAERNELHRLQRKLGEGAEIDLSIEGSQVTVQALERARWGIYSGLGVRLREVANEIYELKKGVAE